MNEPTKLPEASINNDIDALEGFASTSMGDDRAAATAGRLRAYLAHQRAVMEAMAEEIAYHAGCTDCPRTSCAYETKCRSMECTANILAHFEAQVKGGR